MARIRMASPSISRRLASVSASIFDSLTVAAGFPQAGRTADWTSRGAAD
jgi:hypothetical protein